MVEPKKELSYVVIGDRIEVLEEMVRGLVVRVGALEAEEEGWRKVREAAKATWTGKPE